MITGERVAAGRKVAGLTQQGLARKARVSLSTVKRAERGGQVSRRAVRAIAVALDLRVSQIAPGPDAPLPDQDSAVWAPVTEALDGRYPPGGGGMPGLGALQSDFGDLAGLHLATRYTAMLAVLPGLLRDTDTLVSAGSPATARRARRLRLSLRQITGAFLTHVQQHEAAGRAFDLAEQDADTPLLAAAVADERCWGMIRQGMFARTAEYAHRLAAETGEPLATASREELAAWGRLLVRAAAAAVRDNREAEAAEALRLARMAAAGCGPDFLLPYAAWHLYGPVTVQAATSEFHAVCGRPDLVLAIDARLSGLRRNLPVPRFAPSQRLDVASAHVMLGHPEEAFAVLRQLQARRPEWLPRQPAAHEILRTAISQRRRLTGEMRELAKAMNASL